MALAASAAVASFAFGILSYDAFSFIQVTFFVFILIALGASELRLEPARAPLIAQGRRAPARPVRTVDPRRPVGATI